MRTSERIRKGLWLIYARTMAVIFVGGVYWLGCTTPWHVKHISFLFVLDPPYEGEFLIKEDPSLPLEPRTYAVRPQRGIIYVPKGFFENVQGWGLAGVITPEGRQIIAPNDLALVRLEGRSIGSFQGEYFIIGSPPPLSMALTFGDTVPPTLTKEREAAWVAFLMEMGDPQSPNREFRYVPYDNEMGVLLEIARHDDRAILKAAEEFLGEESSMNREGKRDLLRLVARLKLNVPYVPDRNDNSSLWPLKVENARLGSAAPWPDFTTGPMSTRFDSARRGDLAAYERDRRKYGLRDLRPFRPQTLRNDERANLWNKFLRPELRDEADNGYNRLRGQF